MTKFEWCCLLGILAGLALMCWMTLAAWPQEPDPLSDRLEGIEQRLDQLLQQEEHREPPVTPVPPPRPRPARRRVPSMFAPVPAPLADLPRLAPELTVPEEPPPRPCCTWTEETRQQRARVRATAGD